MEKKEREDCIAECCFLQRGIPPMSEKHCMGETTAGYFSNLMPTSARVTSRFFLLHCVAAATGRIHYPSNKKLLWGSIRLYPTWETRGVMIVMKMIFKITKTVL